ncbi:MAG: hypothetical protein KDE48_24480 [Anaerolineales bacterium]|nr:hypothetical protein [Anaerolineales bacterium]
MQELIEQVQQLIDEIEGIIDDPERDRYGFNLSIRMLLPLIVRSLVQIRECLQQRPLNAKHCRQNARGLGRLSLEYVDFNESDLGKRVGQFHDELVQTLEPLLNEQS